LVATLPAYLNALIGKGCIVTVNATWLVETLSGWGRCIALAGVD